MHRKFRQNANEALKALVVGESEQSDTSFADLFLEIEDQREQSKSSP